MKIILYRHDSSEPVTLELSEKEFNALKHFLDMGLSEAGSVDEHYETGEKISNKINSIKFK